MEPQRKFFNCELCKVEIEGTNCAYKLSRAFGWKAEGKCGYYCKCRTPIRAFDVRHYFFGAKIDSNKSATDHAFIFCQVGNQGHVYYGTYSHCERGNGLTAMKMDGQYGNRLSVFDRHWGK